MPKKNDWVTYLIDVAKGALLVSEADVSLLIAARKHLVDILKQRFNDYGASSQDAINEYKIKTNDERAAIKLIKEAVSIANKDIALQLNIEPDIHLASKIIDLFESTKNAKIKRWDLHSEQDALDQDKTMEEIANKARDIVAIATYDYKKSQLEDDEIATIFAELLPFNFVELESFIVNLKQTQTKSHYPALSILIHAAEIRQKQLNDNTAADQIVSSLNEAKKGLFSHLNYMRLNYHENDTNYYALCDKIADTLGHFYPTDMKNMTEKHMQCLRNFFKTRGGINDTERALLFNEVKLDPKEQYETLKSLISKQQDQIIMRRGPNVLHCLSVEDMVELLENDPRQHKFDLDFPLHESLLAWLDERKSTSRSLRILSKKLSEFHYKSKIEKKFLSADNPAFNKSVSHKEDEKHSSPNDIQKSPSIVKKHKEKQKRNHQSIVLDLKLNVIQHTCEEYSRHVFDDLLTPALQSALTTHSNTICDILKVRSIEIANKLKINNYEKIEKDFLDKQNNIIQNPFKHDNDGVELEDALKKARVEFEKKRDDLKKLTAEAEKITLLLQEIKNTNKEGVNIGRLKKIIILNPVILQELAKSQEITSTLKNKLAESYEKLNAINHIKHQVSETRAESLHTKKPIALNKIERAITSSAETLIKNNDSIGWWLLKWAGVILGTVFTLGIYKQEAYQAIFQTQTKGKRTIHSLTREIKKLNKINRPPEVPAKKRR